MGGRSSASGKFTRSSMTPQDFSNELEMYVGGGYGSPSEAISNKGISYMKSHMEESTKELYRVEDNKYTAANLSSGQIFQFNNNYRSFSSSSSFIDEAIDEYGVGGDKPAIFVMRGKKKTLPVNKHYKNPYHSNQQEHIAGGKFRVLYKQQVSGKNYVYIEQVE